MQNQYVGDIGDFAKYFLLKKLCGNDLTLGINWYWVKDDGSNAGGFTGYLDEENDKYSVDYDLFNKLKSIVFLKERAVEEIKERCIFPPTLKPIFYDKPVPEELNERNLWFEKSLEEFKSCDLVFCDPDNGLQIKNLNSIKHIKINEIKKYYESNKSVIIYHHAYRMKSKPQQDKIEKLLKDEICMALGSNIPMVQTVFCNLNGRRFFFIVMHHDHKDRLKERIDNLIKVQQIITVAK